MGYKYVSVVLVELDLGHQIDHLEISRRTTQKPAYSGNGLIIATDKLLY